jgi:uncharacterized protein YggU (UPF0235/DUF167 family)
VAAAPPPPWLTGVAGGCVLRVRVTPRAGRTQIAGEREGALLIRLAAAPVEGEANAALIEFLAARLDVPRRALRLAAGAHARDKRVAIDGVTAEAAAARLRPPA